LKDFEINRKSFTDTISLSAGIRIPANLQNGRLGSNSSTLESDYSSAVVYKLRWRAPQDLDRSEKSVFASRRLFEISNGKEGIDQRGDVAA